MKKIILILLFVVSMAPAFALYIIRGKIVDGATAQPLDFVNVALLKSGDATPATGVVSDQNGNFILPKVPKGKYTLKVSFVGYNSLEIPLSVSDKELNMGQIRLFENSKALSEVEVVAQGTQMRFEIDKKVFSVDQNIAAAGGSATEVLQNIPSVDVDNEGNISLRNDANVEVWINGKPSGLTADNRAQILQQMPAESIESIEVMTNPSAKFNPEGTSGIINLVLKKDRRGGYYGSVSAGTAWAQGAVPGLQSGLNLNYNSGKIDAYVNAGYRAMNFAGGGWTDRYAISGADTISLLRTDNSTRRSFSGIFTRAGVDYHLSDKHTIGVSGFGMIAATGRGLTEIDYKLTDFASSAVLRDYSRHNDDAGGRPGMSFSLDYKWDIDRKGSNLLANLTYSSHHRYSDESYLQKDRLSQDSSYIKQSSDGENAEVELKLDYTQKFGENTRLEAGWQSTIENRSSPSSAVDLVTGEQLPAYFNEFSFDERIHAAYLTLGTRFDQLSIQGGIRGEYYWRKPVNVIMDELGIVQMTYDPKVDVVPFPSLFVSYTLPGQNELQLNVTRRVNRPRGRQINPFRDFSDSTNISYGNFDLSPEYSTAMELNYLKSWDAHSMSATLYHRFTDNVIQRVSYMNGQTMESTYTNITRSQNSGMEFVIKNNLFRILNLTSSLNLYYNKMDSARYDNPYDSSISTLIPEQQNFTWSARVMGNVMFGKNTFGQITGDYSAPRLIAQGRETASYSIDLGLRQTLLNRALSINLMVRDLLNSRRRSSVTWGDGFYQRTENYFSGRMIGVSVSYNFGNMKPKKMPQQRDNEMDREMNFEEQ